MDGGAGDLLVEEADDDGEEEAEDYDDDWLEGFRSTLSVARDVGND